MATSADEAIDGRLQRSERSREAIVQAMLDLIGEGIPQPTAQQVASRADVGVRTVFRHFSDMDSLFAVMNERITARVEAFFVAGPQTGPLPERRDGLLDVRLRFFESIAPYMRASALQRPKSTFLQSQHDRNQRALRQDLKRWLPELQDDADLAAALELALSFESFDRLRTDQKLSARRARAVLQRTLSSLLADLPARR